MPVLARGALRALLTAVSVALLGSALVVTPAAAASVSFPVALSGYSGPVLVTAPRGSSRTIFIVERVGRIRVATYSNGGYHKAGTFLDISGPVNSGGGEQGLLGLAFDPGYASNHRFYVSYTRSDGDLVVAEYRRSSSNSLRANSGSRRQVLTVNHPTNKNHNGGMLAFGPDGYLYISTGDGGSAGDPPGNARNTTRLLGKILRIRPRPSGGRAYSIPSSNPFVGRSGNDLVWSYGLRNPWRFSFDRSNGDLWIGDVGQARYEEVDLHTSGKGVNFGWDRCEGNRRYPNSGSACTTGKLPLKVYSHGSAHCAVTGGYAYRGPGDSAWHGRYIYGDYCSGHVWVINRSGTTLYSHDTNYNISGFGEDGSGRLFLVDLGGTIRRVDFGTP